jgi:hypothetical protein
MGIEFNAEMLKKSKKYKGIKRDLTEFLKANSSFTPVFSDLIDDYMSLWVTKELLRIDIEVEGVKSRYNNGGGQEGDKVNPSIDKLRQTNQQMLKILQEVGMTTERVSALVPDEL